MRVRRIVFVLPSYLVSLRGGKVVPGIGEQAARRAGAVERDREPCAPPSAAKAGGLEGAFSRHFSRVRMARDLVVPPRHRSPFATFVAYQATRRAAHAQRSQGCPHRQAGLHPDKASDNRTVDAFRTNAGAMAGFEGWRINVDDFLPRFAITQPFDILPNIISIPFGQFAINDQHSAVLKKAVSVSADTLVFMVRRVLDCPKKHRLSQTLETNGPALF